MPADGALESAHWQKRFTSTDAYQPVAPILGILATLRANQWIILFRSAGEKVTDYFPFRKRELEPRLSVEDPTRIAAHVLQLPDHGAEPVLKRVRHLPAPNPDFPERDRPVLLGENGEVLAIGITRGSRTEGRVISHMEMARPEFESEYVRNDSEYASAGIPETVKMDDEDGNRESFIVPVFYSTDREPSKSSGANAKYSGARSKREQTHMGVCAVSIPNLHRIGHLERPPWWKIWTRLERQKHIILLSTTQLEPNKFWSELSSFIETSDRKNAFVFVHGYNVSFETAALRTAQLATDLQFRGAPVMFSWPSMGNAKAYLSDEGAVQWSRPHLSEFLRSLCKKSQAQSIHMIAHSMGNRSLLEVLQSLNSPEIPPMMMKQLILAAPDVDAGVFAQIVTLLDTKCERVTLYASSNDKALKASKLIHGYARAGEAGPLLMVLKGIDTIDASNVDTDFLGHSAFVEQRTLLQDMFYLIEHGHDPSIRFGLQQLQADGGLYWSFRA